MCDYSLEHLKTTKAVEGEKYIYDGTITHGFLTRDTRYYDITAVCVLPGQRLKLTGVVVHPHWERTLGLKMPRDMVVTVVSRRDNPTKYRSFGFNNDGIELPDGRAIPIALLWRAAMEVVPVEVKKPTPKKRNLATLLGLDKKDEKPLREIERMTRDRVDAD